MAKLMEGTAEEPLLFTYKIEEKEVKKVSPSKEEELAALYSDDSLDSRSIPEEAYEGD